MATNKEKPKGAASKGNTVSKTTHEKAIASAKKVIAEKDIAIQDAETKAETAKEAVTMLSSQNNELAKHNTWLQAEIEKLRNSPTVGKIKTTGDKIGAKEKGWLRWISKHVLATILIVVVIAAACWLYVLYGQRNGLQTELDNCRRSTSEVRTGAAADSARNSVTAIRDQTSQIKETPTPEVKKNGTK